MRKSKKYYFRKIHRYLGVVLGVQFLMWTIGGLYFSWNNIDKVHGDHLRKDRQYLSANSKLVSPGLIVENLKKKTHVDSLLSVQLIEISDKPVYQIRYFSESSLKSLSDELSVIKTQLADAETGKLRPSLNKKEAIKIVKNNVIEPIEIAEIEYLTTVGTHHEYRGRPLPAWAIVLNKPSNSTVYVSAELGTFEAIRHNQWRVFDFLWMLHTMDYQGRDNFGNILIKTFSVFGLVTVLSGFVLYFVSSPSVRKLKRRLSK